MITMIRYFEGNEAVMNASSDDPALRWCKETPSSEQAQAASPTDKGKDKLPVEQCDERVESIGDESHSEFDPEEREMIDSGTTQIEVRVEGGSRTIMIPVYHDLLKNTEVVIQAFSPFCFDVEHHIPEELSDNTLSKSIFDLALTVSHFTFFLALVHF